MRKENSLTDENFNHLLNWLNADRELAGEAYEQIRRKLIKIFRHRGSLAPEELADATIDRVSRKVPDIVETYVGDPATYFYGVAQNIYLESLKKELKVVPMPASPLANLSSDPKQSNYYEQKLQCLEHCLAKLGDENRNLMLEYYRGDKRAKIVHRKELMATSGLPVNAFRMRIHRLKESLQTCLKECLKSAKV